MEYKLFYTEDCLKSLKKLDGSVQKLIKKFIEKKLVHCINPRSFGKSLTADKKGYWRYRIGNYRLIVDIKDNELKIIAVRVGLRSEVYNRSLD